MVQESKIIATTPRQERGYVDYMGIDRTETDWVSFANEQVDRLEAILMVLQEQATGYVKTHKPVTEQDRVGWLNLG